MDDKPRTVTAAEAGVLRTRRVRAYPDGSLTDQAAACESLEALAELCTNVRALVAAHRVSRRALRRAQTAVDSRRQEIEARVVQAPGDVRFKAGERRTPGGLVLP